jgi:glycogen synthase
MSKFRLAISGDQFFLQRYAGLTTALSQRFDDIHVVPSGNLLEQSSFRILNSVSRGPWRPSFDKYMRGLDRDSKGFIRRSRQTEVKLRSLRPDYTLHIFSSFAPVWSEQTRYGMYLDFTMAQAIEEWPPWAAFKSPRHQAEWLHCERRSYEGAETLFTMGKGTAAALIEHYGVVPDKVTTVGSAGNFETAFAEKRTFGTKLLLFQGSEFERKGGDVVVAAFATIKARIPDARLVIIGTNRKIKVEGVEVLGLVEQVRVRELLLKSDLVLAPSRCEPFPAFVIEAMNYGVPSVVTKASGISETVGDGGIVVDRPDPDLVANAAISLITDPARLEAASDAARRIVRDALNWQVVANKIGARIRARNRNESPIATVA